MFVLLLQNHFKTSQDETNSFSYIWRETKHQVLRSFTNNLLEYNDEYINSTSRCKWLLLFLTAAIAEALPTFIHIFFMRPVYLHLPLIDDKARSQKINYHHDMTGRYHQRRRSKSSPHYRCTGCLLLSLVVFSIIALSGIFMLITIALGIKTKLFDPQKKIRAYAKELSFEYGHPSRMCHSIQPAQGELYKLHWEKAFELFRNHAPASVLNVMPEFGNVSENYYTNHTRSTVLLKYIRASYASFFPGFAMVRSGFSKRGTRYVLYSRIYKAGNDAIRENLAAASHSKARLSYKINKRTPSKIFTFVREPAERWVAGYNELEHRWGVQHTYNVSEKCIGCVFHTFPLGKNRVWAFLGDLLLMRLAREHEIQHVYPMSGILRAARNIDFVGRIETFDQDWNRVLKDFIGPIADGYTFNHSMGLHNSSGFEAQKHGLDLLNRSKGFAEILQHILFKDYACFGYKLRVPMEIDILKSQDPPPPQVKRDGVSIGENAT